MSKGSGHIKYAGRILVFLFLALSFPECIEPYSPGLTDFESLLVVDAMLTDEEKSNEVKIYRTIKQTGQTAERVTGASVTIVDERHNVTHLEEAMPGIYRSDSLRFRGQAGKTYTLQITTTDGRKYESDPCTLLPAPSFDSIVYKKDHQAIPGSVDVVPGITVIEESYNPGPAGYYRWSYDECWKFIVPNPSAWQFINNTTILPLTELKGTCWRSRHSDEIITGSSLNQQDSKSQSQIFFFPSEASDRLLIRYSVLVRKMSISRDEYQFWNHLRQVNESGGDIFDKQPFPVSGNIHNVDDRSEPVLGFFHVSGVKSQRLYITKEWAEANDVPLYNYTCDMVAIGVNDFPPPLFPGGGIGWDDIYEMHIASGYSFTEPIFDDYRVLQKLVFVKSECADCTLNGTLVKPSFWTD